LATFSGSPTAYDRILATRFGVAAVDLIAAGGFGRMVCLKNERIDAVDIANAIGLTKMVDPNGHWSRPPARLGFVSAIPDVNQLPRVKLKLRRHPS